MKLLDRLERNFGHLVPNNLTYYLMAGQVITFALSYYRNEYRNYIPLQADLVLQGQLWRLFTFVFDPLTLSPIWFIFALYIYYLYGGTLEKEWGSFRYALYILIVYLASIACAFMQPHSMVSNGYIYTSIFLAFAYLYPDFQIMLFFIIPVKVKWLAALAWISLGFSLITQPLLSKLLIIVSVANFLLFFAKDILASLRIVPRTVQRNISQDDELKCYTCKKTDVIFNYCDTCKHYFCAEHMKSHKHPN